MVEKAATWAHTIYVKEEGAMLRQGTVFAMVAVKDIAVVRDFYGDKLGLNQVEENPACNSTCTPRL